MKKFISLIIVAISFFFVAFYTLYIKKRNKKSKNVDILSQKVLLFTTKVCYTTIKVPLYVRNKIITKRAMSMKPTIFDVANWFLTKESMPHKKLQKLCYYAQAWSLALSDEDISQDSDFQAWVHGPVNVSLWDKYKSYGYAPIHKNKNKPQTPLNTDLLESVWETYGELSGYQLEKLTHEEAPWQLARKGLPEEAPSNRLIDKADMKSFYQSIYSGDGIGE